MKWKFRALMMVAWIMVLAVPRVTHAQVVTPQNGCVSAVSRTYVPYMILVNQDPNGAWANWTIQINTKVDGYQALAEGATCTLVLDTRRQFYWKAPVAAKLDTYLALPIANNRSILAVGKVILLTLPAQAGNQFTLQYNSSMGYDLTPRPFLDRQGVRRFNLEQGEVLVGYGEVVDNITSYPSRRHNPTLDTLFIMPAGSTLNVDVINGTLRKMPVARAQELACTLYNDVKAWRGSGPINLPQGFNPATCPA